MDRFSQCFFDEFCIRGAGNFDSQYTVKKSFMDWNGEIAAGGTLLSECSLRCGGVSVGEDSFMADGTITVIGVQTSQTGVETDIKATAPVTLMQ